MSKLYNIRFLPEAERDLDGIYKDIAENFSSPKAANKITSSIDKALSYLKRDPFIYPMSNMPGYRKCRVFKYLIYYRVIEEEQKVLITHARHGARNIQTPDTK